eukprot:gene10710-56529_t
MHFSARTDVVAHDDEVAAATPPPHPPLAHPDGTGRYATADWPRGRPRS